MTEQTEKMYYPVKLSQDETDYESYMVRRNPVAQACANCRWFAAPMDCYLVECEPLPILPTGWCNRWEAMPQEKEETMIEEIAEALEDAVEVGAMARKPLGERLKAAIDSVLSSLIPHPGASNNAQSSAFKAIGDGWWIAAHTNNFEDKDREILELASHKRFVHRAMAGYVDMPELWMAHIAGTRHGKAQMLDVITDDETYAVTIALGRFDENEFSSDAETEYRSRGDKAYTLSHGFLYPRWAKRTVEIDGRTVNVYSDYNTFEISVLLPGQEANPYTSFSALEEMIDMPLTEESKALVRGLMGKSADKHMPTIERFYDEKEAYAKSLTEMGIRHKDYIDLVGGGEVESVDKAQGVIPGDLLADLFSFQGDTIKALQGVEGFTKSEIDAIRTEMKQYAEAVNEMKRLMEMPATPASESPETVVDIPAAGTVDIKALEDALNAAKAAQAIKDKASPAQEFDPFFGDLQVKKR